MLLYTLARDNECECIRDMLKQFPANGVRLARAAVRHADPDARWQIADFLGTQGSDEARHLLRSFVNDSHEYVRRRALLASRRYDPAFAEQTAEQWILSPDEYSRLAALSILHNFRSSRLKGAIASLRDDPSEFIRKKVAEIDSEV